ncbi:MAG: hypothetical protein RI894_678, partial [Bacteroidota bacterium]
ILAKNKANFEFNAARCTKNLTQFLGKRQAKLALLITDAFLNLNFKKKMMRKLFFQSSLTIAIGVAAYFVADACSFGVSGEEARYSIFDANTSDNAALAPFYFTTDFIYNIDNSSGIERATKQNETEWAKYAGLSDTKGINDVVYTWEPTKMDKWLNALKKEGSYSLAEGANNPFFTKITKDKNVGVVRYLLFAKNCERIGQKYSDGWEDVKPLSFAGYDAKIAEARKLYAAETDKFLKQRYGYQLVMLLRYKADWPACVKAFDESVEPFGKESVVYWWALAHKATATYFTGEKEKADYYFAQVFAHDDYKKVRMNRGYEATNVEKSVTFCKNNQEKAALYTLDAIHSPARTLQNLQKVYEYTPENPDLDALLVREVNKIEDWVLTPRITGNMTANESEAREDVPKQPDSQNIDYKMLEIANLKSDEAYTAKVFTWVKAAASNPKLHNPSLWYVATAHLALILNNSTEANAALKLAESAKGKTPIIDTQIHLTGIMARLNFDKKGGMSHDDLYKDLVWMQKQRDAAAKKAPKDEEYTRNSDYNKWLMALANRADTQENVTMAALFYAQTDSYVSKGWATGYVKNDSYIYYLDKKGTTDNVEEVLTMINSPQKDNLIKLLTDSLGKHVNRLKDVLGTKYLREDKLEKSVAAYETIPKEWFKEAKCGYTIYDTYLRNDPFWAGIQEGKTLHYSRKGFVLRLMGLKDEVKDPTKNQAWAQYQVANGYYNISRNGNAWARSRYWKGSDEANYAHEDPKDEEYFRATRAKKAYSEAAELAKDKAFKALCLRMVAECELQDLHYSFLLGNRYDPEAEKQDNSLSAKKTTTGLGLKANYPEYYKKLFGDCSGWASFLARGK